MKRTNPPDQSSTPLVPTLSHVTPEIARRAGNLTGNHSQVSPLSHAPQFQTAGPFTQATTSQAPVGTLGSSTVQQAPQSGHQSLAVVPYVNYSTQQNSQNLGPSTSTSMDTSPPPLPLFPSGGGFTFSAPLFQPPYQHQTVVLPPLQSQYYSSHVIPSYSYQQQVAPYPFSGGFGTTPFGFIPPFQSYTGAASSTSTQVLDDNEDDIESGPVQFLIYGIFVPLTLKIKGELYYAVKVGSMDPTRVNFGNRFDKLKGPWRGHLKLPTQESVRTFYNKYDNGDTWQACLAPLNLPFNRGLLFLETGLPDNEHTFRAGLLARFGGFSLPSRVISSMLASVQNRPFPDTRNTGHTEFIALRVSDVEYIRGRFIAGKCGQESYPVQLLVGDRAIPVCDTGVLDFADDEIKLGAVKDEDDDEEEGEKETD